MNSTNSEDINLKHVFGFLLSKWKVIALVIFAGILLSGIYYKISQRVFGIRALVLITDEESSTDPSALLFENTFKDVGQRITNEIVMLEAYPLIKQTIEDLKINVEYYRSAQLRKFEVYGNSPISVQFDKKSAYLPYGNEFHVIIKSNTEYILEGNIELENIGKTIEISETLKFGEKYSNQFFSLSVASTDSAKLTLPDDLYFVLRNIDDLSAWIATELQIGLVQEESSIIALSVDGHTPNKWIDFINTLVDNYVEVSLEGENETAENTIQFIDKQLLSISDTLKHLSDQLKQIRINGQSFQSSDWLVKVNKQLAQLDWELNELRLKNEYFKSLFSTITTDTLAGLLSPGVLGLADPLLNNLMSEFIKLQRNLDLLKENGQTNSPYYSQIEFRKSSIKTEVLKNLQSIEKANTAREESLQGQIKKLEKSYEGFPEVERKVIDLQRDFELNEKLYLLLTEKKTEAEITKSSKVSDLKIIEYARLMSSKPKSPTKIVLVIGALMSAALAFFVVLIMAFFDDKIHGKTDLEAIGEISFLGEVDHVKDFGPTYLVSNLKSSLAESLRIVKQNLTFFSANNPNGKTFLVSSFIPGEGKTFISTQLSIIYGLSNKKVVLVDCDLRKSQVHKTLGKPLNKGLSDYLSNQSSIDDIITRDADLGISFITAGTTPPNPTELLLSDEMGILVKKLNDQFDYIILDAPPLSIISDALTLERHITTTILVCRASYTPKDAVAFYAEKIGHGQIKKPSFLINGMKKSDRYTYGSKYAYYEEKLPFWKRVFKA